MNHKLIILESNYWEHFKYAKEMAMYLSHDHPKRVAYDLEMGKMLEEINRLKALE